ncbi:MAG: GNAT family N-acyltransferase [Pseudomonadota bacterium]
MQVTAGRWHGRLGEACRADALSLRARVFRDGGCDADRFDDAAQHLVIWGPDGVAACARLMVQDRDGMVSGYTAQFYDLARFAQTFACGVEMGRICLAPEVDAPDVTRLLLAMTAQVVTDAGADVLFGCASFPETGAALAPLIGSEAPEAWRPAPKAVERVALQGVGPRTGLPPLLRSYLALGAKVSDHAVVDRDLGTVHVFTGLPVAAISPVRAKLLRSLLAPA